MMEALKNAFNGYTIRFQIMILWSSGADIF